MKEDASPVWQSNISWGDGLGPKSHDVIVWTSGDTAHIHISFQWETKLRARLWWLHFVISGVPTVLF